MKYRAMGRCGLKLSALSLGGWTTFRESITDAATVRTIIRAAYEHGVNFFDMADAYARGEAERVMGQALRELPRHTLVLASKVFRPMSGDVNDRGFSRKHIMEAVDRSLRRIGTDYLDLYFCHRDDPDTPVEETVRAMDDLVRAGKVLYWGTSEWPAAMLQEALELAGRTLYRPQVEQDIAGLVDRHGLGVVVWGPLAFGLLTGKYDDGLPDGSRLARIPALRDAWYRKEHVDRVRLLRPIAEGLGVTRAQLVLAWLLERPHVSSVITGAATVEQVESNLRAVDLALPGHVRDAIETIFPVEVTA
jgi:aryl-alcohol dehydrogenase-like predicted oxidoreductase